MKYIKNEKGFGAFEGIIIVVALVAIGTAGFFAYQARQDKTDYSVNIPHKSNKPAPSASSPSTVDDNSLIIAAVKAQSKSGTPGLVVGVTQIVGDNAMGTTASSDGPGGAAFYAHKASGAWTLVFEGQEKPGKAVGEKYGFPADWYSTDY